MRHFEFLTSTEEESTFAVLPKTIEDITDRRTRAMALGATLYSPGTRTALDADARKFAAYGGTSMVWCLEDAIAHESVPQAERNIVDALLRIHDAESVARYPMLFVRVRDAEQIRRLAAMAGPALSVLTGFSLPKVTAGSLTTMLGTISSLPVGKDLFAMPILETREVAYTETRRAELAAIAQAIKPFQDQILCLRVGGTDLSGLFGLRRDRDTTIWDVAVVRDALSDIVNQFGRHNDYVIAAAVWEHIPGNRLFKPQLRETPFDNPHASNLRRTLITQDVDALMREISLDRNNGMYGKTVIHPTHGPIVNAMMTVTREEYDDALAINANSAAGGVVASAHGRMNEMGPHALWADQILARADAYGVLHDDEGLVDLLLSGQRAIRDASTQTSGATAPIR